MKINKVCLLNFNYLSIFKTKSKFNITNIFSKKANDPTNNKDISSNYKILEDKVK